MRSNLVHGALMVLGVLLQVVKGRISLLALLPSCFGLSLFRLKRSTRAVPVPDLACPTPALQDAHVALPTPSAWGLLRTADGQLRPARPALETPGWTPPLPRRQGVALN